MRQIDAEEAEAAILEGGAQTIGRFRLPEVRARVRAGRLTDFEQIFFLALGNYNPKPYPRRVALFRALTKSDETLSGWRDLRRTR